VHIYWASRLANAIADDPAIPSYTSTWDNGNLTERLDYLGLYSEMRLDWLRFKYIPCNMTIVGLGGPSGASVQGTGVTSALMIDTTSPTGPDNNTVV